MQVDESVKIGTPNNTSPSLIKLKFNMVSNHRTAGAGRPGPFKRWLA